jgi:hypothetical protein
MDFIVIYYTATLASLLVIPMFVAGPSFKHFTGPRTAIVLLVVLVYALGMSRYAGVDMENYIYAFESDPAFIPDIGFQSIIEFYSALGLPFFVLMLSIAATNFFAITRLASHFNLSFGLMLIIWFFHIVVVRDFAQLRSSLAISLAIIGLTSSSGTLKWLLYLGSASVHLTSVIFILAYETCSRVSAMRSKLWQWLVIGVLSAIAIVGGMLLPHLGFLNERIEIYLLWTEDGYGAPVGSFGILFLHILILAISLVSFRSWSVDARLRTVFYLEILGIVAFVSLSSYGIFAFRLSNLVLSLYSVLILAAIKAMGERRTRYTDILQKFALLLIGLVLILRPGSVDILERIKI